MDVNPFASLASSENQTIAILAFCNIVLAAVIVTQWRHTLKSTVPYAIWKEHKEMTDKLMDIQRDDIKTLRQQATDLSAVAKETNTIIKTRL